MLGFNKKGQNDTMISVVGMSSVCGRYRGREYRLLALLRHDGGPRECPFIGVERKSSALVETTRMTRTDVGAQFGMMQNQRSIQQRGKGVVAC
jgi:hypothetical protein